jgi:hypothetical protein
MLQEKARLVSLANRRDGLIREGAFARMVQMPVITAKILRVWSFTYV